MFYTQSMVKVGRRAEHAEDTRTAILDAAERLFTEPGFAAATLDDIAEQARVTKGAVYHHFGSKPALFRAVVERLFQRLVEDLAARGSDHKVKAGGDVWDAVCATYQARLDLVCADAAFQRILDHDAIAVLGYETLNDIAQSTANAALVPVLEEAIHTGLIEPIAADTLAKLMGALIGVASREIAAAQDTSRARRELGQALDAFLQGLRRRRRSEGEQRTRRTR
jgi:AcrR family transcriptional regulator